jgi:hypothetical protein
MLVASSSSSIPTQQQQQQLSAAESKDIKDKIERMVQNKLDEIGSQIGQRLAERFGVLSF